MRLRMSGRQKAFLAVALLVVMWLPTGVSHEPGTPIVTGHSSFYNTNGYDPCLASLAGILRSRVMWFNHQVLVERYGGKGTYIMATEYGAPDPRAKNLFSEGVFYDFTDPNGVQWHVEEAWYSTKYGAYTSTGTAVEDPGNPEYILGQSPNDHKDNVGGTSGSVENEYSASTVRPEDKYYVWFVELSAHPIYDEFHGADPHTYYNFLNLIDTCKFDRERMDELQDANDDPYPYYATENHSGSELGTEYGHPAGAESHDHEKFLVDLWISTKPKVTPFGEISTNPQSWESGWAEYAVNETRDDAGVPEGFEESLP